MVNNENTCLYCKEEIKPEAIKCKHCSSKLVKATPSHPSHEGVCPFCKESIKPDAIKCKHCKTSLATDSDCGYNDVNGSKQVMSLTGIKLCRSPEYPFFYPCGYELYYPKRKWLWDPDPRFDFKPQPDPWKPDPTPWKVPLNEVQGHFNEYLDSQLVNRELSY